MVPLLFRSIVAGVVFLLAGACAQAACQGRNVWPEWQQRYPAVIRKIEERARLMPYGEGKLFRVVREGRTDSYVLGTNHGYDPRYIPLSPGILAAFEQTSVTVLELEHLTPDDPMKLLGNDPVAVGMQIFAPAGERPLDFLTEDEQKVLSQAMEGFPLPPSTVLTMRPAFTGMMLGLVQCGEFSDPVDKPGVDMAIENLSRSKKKPVIGLETFAEQLQSVNGLPFDQQQDILRTTLKTLPAMPDMRETAKILYIEGQIGKIVALMYEDDPDFTAYFGSYPKTFIFKLVDERNLRMRDRSMPLLDAGGAFIAVGAAHLPGEHGLLKLLEEAGYRIEKVE